MLTKRYSCRKEFSALIAGALLTLNVGAALPEERDLLQRSRVTFLSGAEFPGAKGSVTASVGPKSSIGLNYDLGCGTKTPVPKLDRKCGAYVGALVKLDSPIYPKSGATPAIAFDISGAGSVAQFGLRVYDSSGQTLQYKVEPRPIENSSGSHVQRVQVSLSSPASYWGGAKDGVIHYPISSFAILVGDHKLHWPEASVRFSSVSLLMEDKVSYALKSDSPVFGDGYQSTYVGKLGVAIHRIDSIAFDKANSAGIKIVRTDLKWGSSEKKGRYDFTWQKKLKAELLKRGMSVLWIVDYGHPDHGGAVPTTDANKRAFSEFARQAALALGGEGTYGYEIWNEPNIKLFWPDPNPVAFAALTQMAAAEIRRVDPAAVVISGGLADADQAYLSKMLLQSPSLNVTGISVHPYRVSAPETFSSDLEPLRRIVKSSGLSAPLVDTEWGYPSYGYFPSNVYGAGRDPRAWSRQAVLTLRKVLTSIALNMPLHIIYDLSDDGPKENDREHNFGILTAAGEDKPAMTALKSLYSVQNGRVFRGYVPDVPPGLHLLRWDGMADTYYVVWSDAGGRDVSVTLPPETSMVTSWTGISIDMSKGVLAVRESDGPVFVRVRR